jgi:hypothetical protein
MNARRILQLGLLICPAVLWSQQSAAFYDPNAQRWLSRDPLADNGSVAYTLDRIESREVRSAAERAMMVQQLNDPLAPFTKVNLNLFLFLANNPTASVDPRGLDWLSCMANCIESKDPLNSVGKVCLTYLGGTFPKPWTGYGRIGGSATTVLSWLSLGGGTAASGANAARIVGRIFSPLWVGYGLYLAGVEAACAGTCTGDPTTY